MHMYIYVCIYIYTHTLYIYLHTKDKPQETEVSQKYRILFRRHAVPRLTQNTLNPKPRTKNAAGTSPGCGQHVY